MRLAIDDFGAAWSALNLLSDYQPDFIKLDMALIRGIQSHGPRQAIVRAILAACGSLGIEVIAEGVEAEGEYEWPSAQGVSLFLGYLFAPPGFETLPTARIPDVPVLARKRRRDEATGRGCGIPPPSSPVIYRLGATSRIVTREA